MDDIAMAERLCDAAQVRGGDLATQIFGQLEAWFGTVLDQYDAFGHLPDLSAARISVGKEVVEAADRAYEARLVRMIEAAQAEGKASLARTDSDAHQMVSVLLAAARGAKYSRGAPAAPDAFRTNLQCIAHVFAAAIRAS